MTSMTQEQHNYGVWVAVVGIFLSLFGSVVAISISAGNLKARVDAIELINQTVVTQPEWKQFAADMRDRLDRIERKLDREQK